MTKKLLLKGMPLEEVMELTELPLNEIHAVYQKLFPSKQE